MSTAAAAAVTADTGTAAATAATAVSPTRYERTLRNCARDLLASVDSTRRAAAAAPSSGGAVGRCTVREWAREHRSEATKQAGRFVARLLRDKAANINGWPHA
jgi:hypothetical protein